MLTQKITVVCHSNVGGPNGKLFANHIYELDDSEYVRTLIKSGNVSLVDPPSLDPVFLEKAGYELSEGYVYSGGQVIGPEDEAPQYKVFGIVDSNETASKGPEPTMTVVETTNSVPEGIHESVPEETSKGPKTASQTVAEKGSNVKDNSNESGVQENK